MSLVPCPGCARHVAAHELACPFCGSTEVRAPARTARPVPVLSRAAIAYVGAVLATSACGPGEENIAQPYGAPPDPPPEEAIAQPYGAPPEPEVPEDPPPPDPRAEDGEDEAPAPGEE
jgi:hypothetical protein